MHILEYYAGLFKQLNLKFSKNIKFGFPRAVSRKYSHLKEKKKKVIIVHPGGRYNKQWRTERLLLFLEKIKNKRSKFIILLGPDEYDVEEMFFSRKYDIIKPVDVMDLISVLSIGKIYIGND